MKRLEDIPKKKVFDVPEGYFEKLPGIIQSRVASREKQSSAVFRIGLRLAMPALLIGIAVIFWINRSDSRPGAEKILASVQTKDLIAYLKEADFTTDELLDQVQLDADDVAKIEESVYEFELDQSEIEDILTDIEP